MNTAVHSPSKDIPPRSYAMTLERVGTIPVTLAWPAAIDAALGDEIVRLMRQTTEATPIIGFGTAISDQQAHLYIEELNANLAVGKCHLLAVLAQGSRLIGKCVLRRNLNPNNSHIAELAKGMICEEFRGGGLVLAAAFVEISRLCAARGIELLTLDVRAGTYAHRVWERFGFRTYGVLEDYARSDGQSIAGHFMAQSVADLRTTAAHIVATANIRSIADDAHD